MGFLVNIAISYHVTCPSAVCGQTNFKSLALHVVPPEPDGVLGVGAREPVLGELGSSVNCEWWCEGGILIVKL